jgi:peptidoglycan/xylan/chitin deacetylase (PgdA/CDA1 family)
MNLIVPFTDKTIMSSKLNILFIIFLSFHSLYGDTTFSNLDLNENNILLFKADHKGAYEEGSFSALIKSDLNRNDFKLLTHYPEESFIVDSGKELFIWNRFGLYLKEIDNEILPSLIDLYPSLERGNSVQLGKLLPLSISPNGNFLLYYRSIDWSRGDLIIYDRSKGYSQLVTSHIEKDYTQGAIKWSPNSQFFAYTKDRGLYYFPIEKFLNDQLPSEETRRLSSGSPGSFRWGSNNSLYYIVDNEVMSVNTSEMFALSFYDKPLQIGTVAGQLFFNFNPNFDNFWISPNGKKILIKREEGAVFLLDLTFRNYSNYSEIGKFPFLNIPAGFNIKDIKWSSRGKVLLLIGSELKGENENRLFIYNPDNAQNSFLEVEEKGVLDIAVSPGNDLVSLLYPDKLILKVFDSWKVIRNEKINHKIRVHWTGKEKLVLMGKYITTIYDITSGSEKFLFLSQCSKSGYSLDGKIKVEEKGTTFVLDKENRWKATDDIFYNEVNQFNNEKRVFLVDNNNPIVYKNQIMVRSINDFSTKNLIDDLKLSYEPFPENDPIPQYSTIFNHGSRIRRRELSLVFNITDSITDLTDILNVLAEYNIRATFFVNGNVIRKYPQAIKMLSQTNHEVGSLFYTVIDMTDRQYNIDKEFIKRGLARNEDDYFRATGEELLPIWHAPWYFVDSQIVEASEEMNYTYIGRDFDTLDWIGIDDELLYHESSYLMKKIMEEKKPGSILTFSVGTITDREDYLFQKLEILINGLIKEGYRLVTVGELRENEK